MCAGADPGEGAHPARAPPKIGKNKIFWRKIVIFHTKYPKHFRASLRSAQFFKVRLPQTWNPGFAPGVFISLRKPHVIGQTVDKWHRYWNFSVQPYAFNYAHFWIQGDCKSIDRYIILCKMNFGQRIYTPKDHIQFLNTCNKATHVVLWKIFLMHCQIKQNSDFYKFVIFHELLLK